MQQRSFRYVCQQMETAEIQPTIRPLRLYPQDALQRFQFGDVLQLLEKHCMSQPAKELARSLVPIADYKELKVWLYQTQELFSILSNGLYFPRAEHPNIAKSLSILHIGDAVIEAKQALDLKSVVQTALSIIRFLHEKQDLYPHLYQIVQTIERNEAVIKVIDEIVEEPGEVKSSASKVLSETRSDLATQRQRSARTFLAQMRKYQKLGWLVDFNEGIYSGRRVLAVLAEYKRKVSGIVHGHSETGKVAYIEPASNVELNNLVAELEEKERREVYLILKKLTARLRVYLPDITAFHRVLTEIDFVRAKALLAIELKACLPEINNKRTIKLRNGVHPILWLQLQKEGKTSIPLNLDLYQDKRMLIISGPNAGGKSIALKTMGLLQLMLQSGLLLPVAEGTSMHLFNKFFVDIGDDQSIEYELSTYSSRLKKMRYFLEFTDKSTFVFIDEFGTGSDPEMGGVMAETILEDLTETDCFGIITTHYTNIKLLAESKPGLVNASMLFDKQSLRPKFEISIGQPGSSYTFEVAKKIGLHHTLIERAKGKLNNKKVQLDKLLVKLQDDKNKLKELQEQNAKEKSEAERTKILFTDLQNKLLEKEKADAAKRVETEKLLALGVKYQKLFEDWQKNKDKKALVTRLTTYMNNEIKKISDKEEEKKKALLQKRANRKPIKPKAEPKVEPPKIGDRVKMKGGSQIGILEELKGSKATVLFDTIKMTIDTQQLLKVQTVKS